MLLDCDTLLEFNLVLPVLSEFFLEPNLLLEPDRADPLPR